MRAIVSRSPGRALIDPFYHPMSHMDEFDALAREMWKSWEPLTFHPSFMSSLDIYEENDELVVKADLPGLKNEDINISLEEGVLTVKAEREDEEVSEDATHYLRERRFGKYSRSMKLPFQVDGENISATMERGVLHIRLPKAEEAKPKHIEVSVQ